MAACNFARVEITSELAEYFEAAAAQKASRNPSEALVALAERTHNEAPIFVVETSPGTYERDRTSDLEAYQWDDGDFNDVCWPQAYLNIKHRLQQVTQFQRADGSMESWIKEVTVKNGPLVMGGILCKLCSVPPFCKSAKRSSTFTNLPKLGNHQTQSYVLHNKCKLHKRALQAIGAAHGPLDAAVQLVQPEHVPAPIDLTKDAEDERTVCARCVFFYVSAIQAKGNVHDFLRRVDEDIH